MLIRSVSSRDEAATPAYALGRDRLARSGADYRRPRVLAGNVRRLERVLGSGPNALRCISWMVCFEEALADEVLRAEAIASIGVVFPGIPLTEIAHVVVGHEERPPWTAEADDPSFRSAAHVLIAPVHLPTGRALSAPYAPVDRPRLELFAELRNIEGGYVSPKDADRVRRGHQARTTSDAERREGLKLRWAIDEIVSAAQDREEVTDGPSLLRFLTGQGITDVTPGQRRSASSRDDNLISTGG